MYTIWTEVLGHLYITYLFHIVPLFAAMTASTLPGRGCARFSSMSLGIFTHKPQEAFARSDTDLGQEGQAHNLHSSSSQRCLLEVRALCRPVKFFHAKLIHQAFLDLALCTGAQSCCNRKGASSNCSH